MQLPRSLLAAPVLLCLAMLASTASSPSRRVARNVVFPGSGAKVQIILGFGIPVELPHQAVTIGYVLKCDYNTPDNATMFTRPYEAFPQAIGRSARPGARSARSARGLARADTAAAATSRWQLYGALQLILEQGRGRASWGRQCLLRAVCDAAAFSLRRDGLLEELLHVLLTPSSTKEPVLQHHDMEFHAAERAGRLARASPSPSTTCQRLFSGCSAGALDLFTKLLPF